MEVMYGSPYRYLFYPLSSYISPVSYTHLDVYKRQRQPSMDVRGYISVEDLVWYKASYGILWKCYKVR